MARLQEIVQSFSGLFWRKDKRGRKNLKCLRKKQMNGGESYTQKNRHRLLQIMDPQQVQNKYVQKTKTEAEKCKIE